MNVERAIDYAERVRQLVQARREREDKARRLYDDGQTLKEVGEQMGVTAERARQMIRASQKREEKMITVDQAQLDPRVIETMGERIAELEQHIVVLTAILDGMKSVCRPDILLDSLELSARTYNCLVNELHYRGVPLSLSQVTPMARSELLRVPNFGHKSYAELWHVMVHFGFWQADDAGHAP